MFFSITRILESEKLIVGSQEEYDMLMASKGETVGSN
jgi:hypothetical protein